MKKRTLEKHGMEDTSEYHSWYSMKNRCYNKNYHLYHRYGGRGILMCDRWKNSFLAFFKDMGLKPFRKAQIDRIDNNGNYEPNNCRWISVIDNNRNKSTTKLSMEKAREIRKEKLSRKELALMYNVGTRTIGDVISLKSWREDNGRGVQDKG